VDARDYIDRRVKYYENKMIQLQAEAPHKKTKPLAYVTFTDVKTARLCQRSILDISPHRWNTHPAEEPRDIYWSMGVPSHFLKMAAKVIIVIAVIALIIFMSIPLQAALALANLQSIGQIPGVGNLLVTLISINSFVKGIIEGLLPVLVIIIFYALIVPFLRFMSRREFIRSRSNVEASTEKKYVALLFINVFAQSLLGGTVWAIIDELSGAAMTPATIVTLLAVKIPAQVNFFISFVVAHSFLSYLLMLLRPFDLAKMIISKKTAKSQRESREVYQRQEFDYARMMGNHMLIFLIILVFGVIAPLILLFGFAYFIVAYLVDYHNLYYVYRQKWEGHGNMWPALFGEICIALAIFQLTLIGVISLVGFWPSVFLIPLPFITLAFYIQVNRRYFTRQHYSSLDLIPQDFAITVLEMKEAYIHPALAPITAQEQMDQIEVNEIVEESRPNDAPPAVYVEKDNEQTQTRI